MFQNFNPKLVLEVSSVIIFIITIYYNRSKSFKERNFGLVLTSFFQGILLSVIFPKYLFFASILALLYYLFFSYFWQIKFLFTSQRLNEYDDEKLVNYLKQLPEIKKFAFEFKKYSGINSLNAYVMPPIPFITNKFKISFGEELISKFTFGEKKFVLAHEIGHALKKHFLTAPVLFFLLVMGLGFVSLILNIIVLIVDRNYFVQFDYISTFFLFITGIIGINLISWHYEYDADKKAIQLTRDVKSFESGLSKLEYGRTLKDYGRLINLIIYTHPLTNNRIKNGKEFYNQLK